MHIQKPFTPITSKLALACAALFASASYAANGELEQLVVTATRQETRSNDLLSDVSIITREQIEQAGQTTLEQLLARQPGIEYAASGGPGTNSSIFMRGGNASQTLVLIDGLRIGAVSNGAAAFSRIPLAQIERIEILRGPASSLYGADAIGGVIQIFTRRGDGATHYNASLGYGTNNTTEGTVGVAGATELASYSLQAGHYQTTGFSAIGNPASDYYNPDHDGYRNTNFSGNFAVRPALGHELGLNILHSGGTSSNDYSATNDDANEQIISSYSVYSRNRLARDWNSTLRVGRSTDDSTSRLNGVANSVYRTDQEQIIWQNDVKLPIGQSLFAAEHLKQTLQSTTAFQVSERTIRSLLAGWNGGMGAHRLQFNVRRDENSQFGGKNTGFAGYGYQLTQAWRTHLSYGTAFRAPSFNDLYDPSPQYPQYAGNPQLRPESSRNREIEVVWEKGAERFSALYFNNKVSDLIVGYPLINVGSATLAGTSLSYSASVGNWNGGVVVDLQRARDDTTNLRLARRADEQLKTHLTYSTGVWKVGGEWQLTSERFEVDYAKNTMRLGGYSLTNLFVEQELEKNWRLFVRANNIFDKRYELAQDFAAPSASLFVGLRYSSR